MKVVYRDIDGFYKREELLDIDSLESLQQTTREKEAEVNFRLTVVSKHTIEYRDNNGKLLGTYHLCNDSGHRIFPQ